MKLEKYTLLYSLINNLIVAIIKIWGGIFFNLKSFFADGLHTFSDFITDIFSLIALKISKHRATKNHPFGFGKIEYISNLFIGFILLFLSFYIIYNSFTITSTSHNFKIIYLIILVIILKCIAIYILQKVAKKIKSDILLTNAKESKTDLYSSIGVLIISILLLLQRYWSILSYADFIGTIFIGLLVFKTSISILIDNSLILIGEVENNPELIKKVKCIVEEDKRIKNNQIVLIKYGYYYRLQLIVELDNNLNLREISKIERKIKRNIIRNRSLKIKYVNINFTNNTI